MVGSLRVLLGMVALISALVYPFHAVTVCQAQRTSIACSQRQDLYALVGTFGMFTSHCTIP